MVTRPLDLLSKLRKPPANLDALYFVNAALIALFFVMFGSRFVISPGIVIGSGADERDFTLPTVTGASALGRPTSLMISVAGRDVVLTRDGKMNFEDFRRWITEQGAAMKAQPDRALLVRADVSLPLKDMLEIHEAARKAGFVVVGATNEPVVPRDRRSNY